MRPPVIGSVALESDVCTRVSIAKLRAVHATTHPAGNDHTSDDGRLRVVRAAGQVASYLTQRSCR